MAADSFHEKPLHIRQSKDLFGKGVKPGFAQLFRLRCDTLDGCATGDEPVRPLAPISFFIVGGSVFKALNFVLFLRKLPLHLFFLGLQLFNFLFLHDFNLLTVKDGCKKTAYVFGRRSA